MSASLQPALSRQHFRADGVDFSRKKKLDYERIFSLIVAGILGTSILVLTVLFCFCMYKLREVELDASRSTHGTQEFILPVSRYDPQTVQLNSLSGAQDQPEFRPETAVGEEGTGAQVEVPPGYSSQA